MLSCLVFVALGSIVYAITLKRWLPGELTGGKTWDYLKSLFRPNGTDCFYF